MVVRGLVQGVAYRAFTQHSATRLGLTGGVTNLTDGQVSIEVEGSRAGIDEFLNTLWTGPPLARVEAIEVHWDSPTGQYGDFQVW